MTSEIKELVPDIGDFSGVEVIEVLVSEGDRVAVEDSVVTLESDKATMEIPATHAGVVTAVKVKVGDIISAGDLLLILNTEGASAGETGRAGGAETPGASEGPGYWPAADQARREEDPLGKWGEVTESSAVSGLGQAQPTAMRQAPPRLPGDKVTRRPPVSPHPSDQLHGVAHASPSIRSFARELGVDLMQVEGSGRKGRITKADVQRFIKQLIQAGGAPSVASGPTDLPTVDFSWFGEVEARPLGRIRWLSGQHLSACWLNIPHVTQFERADITALEAFRQEQKRVAERPEIKLTLMPFLLKACVDVLKVMPDFNSSLGPERVTLIYKHYINIGVAVDTPKGLVVPVIHGVDKKSIFELAAELAEISARAREGKLGPADLEGGCFSISNLGGIGGIGFTPIINAPEVAILGVSRSSIRPVWSGKKFKPRLMLPLSLSYDHRVIDGAQAARFIVRLSDLLADIRRLLL